MNVTDAISGIVGDFFRDTRPLFLRIKIADKGKMRKVREMERNGERERERELV